MLRVVPVDLAVPIVAGVVLLAAVMVSNQQVCLACILNLVSTTSFPSLSLFPSAPPVPELACVATLFGTLWWTVHIREVHVDRRK